MKRVLKHPLSWCAVGCFVVAAGMVVIGSSMHPKVPVINKVEKAMNEADTNLMQECFYNASKEEAALIIGMNASSVYGKEGEIEVHYLYGDNKLEATDEETGDKQYTNQMITVTTVDGEVEVIDVVEADINEIDGKQYIGY